VADQGQHVISLSKPLFGIIFHSNSSLTLTSSVSSAFLLGLNLTILLMQKSLPYPLLSDRKRVLIGALGAADGAKTKRSHFVFGKDGTLLDKKLPVKPADSPRLALEFVKGLASE
jgi:hypothetical protein